MKAQIFTGRGHQAPEPPVIISTSDVDGIDLRCHGRRGQTCNRRPCNSIEIRASHPYSMSISADFGLPAKRVPRFMVGWQRLWRGYRRLDREYHRLWAAGIGPPLGDASHRQCPPASVHGTQIVCGNRPAVLLAALDNPIDPASPEGPPSLRVGPTSTRNLANELTRQGHPISPRTVAVLYEAKLHSLQANRGLLRGAADHPDRDAQFCMLTIWSLFGNDNAGSDLRGLQKKENPGRFQERRVVALTD